MLDSAAVQAGYRHIVFDTLGSTNEEALSQARADGTDKLWVVARRQTRGRGRAGRLWSSPEGNLYASLLLLDPAAARHAPQLGFVAGLALALAVSDVVGARAGTRIKWPNDLVHDGAKFAGILIEGTQTRSGPLATVIGFGVNCRSHPTGLDYPTTDIESFAGVRCSPISLLDALSRRMVENLEFWDRGRNFSGLRDRWLALALPKGAQLTAKTPSLRTEGAFETIDDDGRLVLATASGFLTVDAADVFLTGQDNPAKVGAGMVS